MDEARLIADARKGSEAAAGELFRRFWPFAWQWAYAVVGNRALADEVAQDAIVRCFGTLDRFDAERRLAPWLKRIVVNRAIDVVRHERRARSDVFSELRAAVALDEDADLVDAVLDGVMKLPTSQRTAVVLHYWLDLSVDEISTMLRIPVGTVVSRLSRARSVLRERLER